MCIDRGLTLDDHVDHVCAEIGCLLPATAWYIHMCCTDYDSGWGWGVRNLKWRFPLSLKKGW